MILQRKLTTVNSLIRLTSSTNGRGRFDIFEDNVFYFSEIRRTWQNSHNFCRNVLNASLPYNLDGNINSYLKNKLGVWRPASDCAWIGAYGGGSYWRWETKSQTTVQITWSDWGPNEPDNSHDGLGCVYMYSKYRYRWDDDDCDWSLNFVCMKTFILNTQHEDNATMR